MGGGRWLVTIGRWQVGGGKWVKLIALLFLLRPILPTFGAIRAIYYDAICACVKEVVERIIEARDKSAVENKDLLKSRSDWGILGSLRNR